ncbi:phytanoyl-CoA dioxygenase family protein [Aurantimonas sp. A2-1-M11]|uniref:phytanoyl-CoA dioxygenase family protein n=1 Tax=Aurantimonas sp. A2-1-M11 TaxID=3113712 RepID=UPI002F92CB70
MLSAEQIARYRTDGYLLIENAIGPDEIKAIRDTALEFIERSRALTESDDVYDLDDGHSAETPRLTRIKVPHKQHPIFDGALRSDRMKSYFTDFLGPNVALQTTKLNTKAPGGGAAVEWHQDWAFYPHTNDDMLAFGLMLEDVDEENGPLMVIPGSHKGPVLSHHNNGVFCGAVNPDDPEFHFDKAIKLTGKAGDMSVHHARTLHGSAPNRSDRARMIMFFEACSADAWPLLGAGSYIHRLGQQAMWDDLRERMICGEPVLSPRIETNPVRLPLPPASDASSIFKSQKSGGAKSAFAA